MQAKMLVMGLCLVLAACGGGGSSGSAATTAGSTTSQAGTTTVNLVVTDTPATNVTVLSFEVEISSAVLQPGSVSLLPKPITVDLAQLVSDTGFLTSTVIGSTTYTSLQITLANPKVTLLNNSTATLTLPNGSCAAGATCTYSPALNNASITISNGVFPLTLTASSTTGLSLDLSIPDLLQSDLSVTLANGSAVNLALLPGNTAAAQVRIDDVFGTVTAINGSQINLTTAFGNLLVLDTSSSTSYAYPANVCTAAAASCLAAGQIVTADLSLAGSGHLSANSISYVGASGASMVKGLVLSVDSTSGTPSAQVLIQRQINAATLTAGQVAKVTLPSNAAFAVGVVNYPAVSTAGFASVTDLIAGQEIIASVGSDLVAGSTPTFSSSTVYLESSQLVGRVAAVNSAAASLQVDGLSGLFTGARPIVQTVGVQTGPATTFVGFSSAALTALSVGQFVVAKGPLVLDTAAHAPVVQAIQLDARANGN